MTGDQTDRSEEVQ